MKSILDPFRVPAPQLKETTPVLLKWKIRGVVNQCKADNFKQGRIKALQIIGRDDRIVVGVFNRSGERMYGKVGLYAGSPYWLRKGEYQPIDRNGNIVADYYDF